MYHSSACMWPIWRYFKPVICIYTATWSEQCDLHYTGTTFQEWVSNPFLAGSVLRSLVFVVILYSDCACIQHFFFFFFYSYTIGTLFLTCTGTDMIASPSSILIGAFFFMSMVLKCLRQYFVVSFSLLQLKRVHNYNNNNNNNNNNVFFSVPFLLQSTRPITSNKISEK